MEGRDPLPLTAVATDVRPSRASAPASDASAQDAEYDALRLFAERELSVDAHGRMQRFFLALDRRTDPRTAEPRLRDPIRRLMGVYDTRQSYRVHFASIGRGIELDPPSAPDLETAREVSRVVVDCAHALEGHAWDLAPLAFELFAAGRLVAAHPDPRLQARLHAHGAPDGWYFFQFAEHAFVCVEAGIDAGFWDPLLAPLVAASDLLAHHGRGELTPRMTSEERCARLAQYDGRVLPMSAVERVRARYRAHLSGRRAADRRRRLADLFAHVMAQAGFGRFSSVFHAPGRLRPLLEERALGAT